MEEITIIIKTFERFECVKRLVKSIYKYYPNAIILIGDDSEVSCKEYFEKKYFQNNICVYELEKDCGLSYGRNYLVDKVKTQYFLLLDDDFVFDKKTNIMGALSLLKEKKLDILGGYFRNYQMVTTKLDNFIVTIQTIFNREKASNYIGELVYDGENKVLYANYIINEFPEFCLTDITHNFFLAKTKKILEDNRWDDELKLQEHTAFFFAAKKKNFRVGFSSSFSIQHKPVRLKKYSNFRGRDFTQLFMKKNDIEKIISTFDGKDSIEIVRI